MDIQGKRTVWSGWGFSANCYVITNSNATLGESCCLLSCVQCGILKILKIPFPLMLRFLSFTIQVRTCPLTACIYVLPQWVSLNTQSSFKVYNFCVRTSLSPLLPPPPLLPPSVSSSSLCHYLFSFSVMIILPYALGHFIVYRRRE